MPPGKHQEHEAGEGSPHLFSEGVTFGHSYEDLDMDQIATWYIAMRFGHIPDTIPSQHVQFTDELPDIDNNRLVIEGIPSEQANPAAGKVSNGTGGREQLRCITMLTSAQRLQPCPALRKQKNG